MHRQLTGYLLFCIEGCPGNHKRSLENYGNSIGNKAFGYCANRRLVMKYAVPSVISLLVNALYNIVDQIFIGQGVGYLGNAATNVIFP